MRDWRFALGVFVVLGCLVNAFAAIKLYADPAACLAWFCAAAFKLELTARRELER